MSEPYKSSIVLVKPVGKLKRKAKEISALSVITEQLKANINIEEYKCDDIRMLHFLACLVENSQKLIKSSKTPIHKMDVVYAVLEKVFEKSLTPEEKEKITDQIEFLLELKIVSAITLVKLVYENAKVFLKKAIL